MSAWDKCEQIAREYDEETGRELVLICDLPRHEAPGDTGVVHHDPRLSVWWAFDDEEARFDGDPG